jgi:hypothetical protein
MRDSARSEDLQVRKPVDDKVQHEVLLNSSLKNFNLLLMRGSQSVLEERTVRTGGSHEMLIRFSSDEPSLMNNLKSLLKFRSVGRLTG